MEHTWTEYPDENEWYDYKRPGIHWTIALKNYRTHWTVLVGSSVLVSETSITADIYADTLEDAKKQAEHMLIEWILDDRVRI